MNGTDKWHPGCQVSYKWEGHALHLCVGFQCVGYTAPVPHPFISIDCLPFMHSKTNLQIVLVLNSDVENLQASTAFALLAYPPIWLSESVCVPVCQADASSCSGCHCAEGHACLCSKLTWASCVGSPCHRCSVSRVLFLCSWNHVSIFSAMAFLRLPEFLAAWIVCWYRIWGLFAYSMQVKQGFFLIYCTVH